jgi:hypothetical protein
MEMPYDELNKIIEQSLKPLLKTECEKLGIPQDFIKGIYPIFPKSFEYTSACEPIVEGNKIEGVRIRIDCTITKPGPALRDFWHEMRHAKDCYEGKNSSEIKAEFYSLKRRLQYLLWRKNIFK